MNTGAADAKEQQGDPERLRLLEGIAAAAQAAERSWLNAVGRGGRSFAESLEIVSDHINSYRRAVLEALAALEALEG